MSVPILHESRRGCGYRKAGGMYLIGGGDGFPCCRMPFRLETCPCCGHGLKPSRGFTWVQLAPFIQEMGFGECKRLSPLCPLAGEIDPELRVGLIWIGETHYATPAAFMAEARKMGISRRIPALPRGFEIGSTWVLLAHRKVFNEAIPEEERLTPDSPLTRWIPGAFYLWRPERVEVVVPHDRIVSWEREGSDPNRGRYVETFAPHLPDEELDALRKRGLTPVIVIPEKE